MKQTSLFRAMCGWVSSPQRIREIAHVDTLAAARFETIYWDTGSYGWLDLTFARGDRTATITGVVLNLVALGNREGAFIWPAGIVDDGPFDETLAAIEAAVRPWVRTVVRGRTASGESLRRYADAPAFDAARERGDPGAAPLGVVLAGVAPFVYARRFARGATVELRCRHAARGAAVLGDIARELWFADDPAACAWFDRAGAAPAGQAELAIVEDVADAPAQGTVVVRSVDEPCATPWRTIAIPQPVPLDLPLTFDEVDAPAVGWFGVRAAAQPARERRIGSRPLTAKASSGRIALLVRPDARFAADADLDEAGELAALLEGIGIAAAVCASDDEVRAHRPDLVHAFVSHDHPAWYGAAARLRGFGVPYAVSVAPLGAYAEWEEKALYLLTNCVEDGQFRGFAAHFESRTLSLPPGEPQIVPAPADVARVDSELRALLAGAIAVFSINAAPSLRERFGLPATLHVANPGILLAPEPPEDDVSALIPTVPFALVHAPFLARNHVLSVISQRGELDLPLVIAGPVSDVLYAARIQRHAPAGLVVIADPSPGTVAALYRRAAVFVEPSLRPAGAARLARAVLCGALPLVPDRSALAPLIAPPASVYDALRLEKTPRVIAQAIADPQRAEKIALLQARLRPLCETETVFRQYLAGYALATRAGVS